MVDVTIAAGGRIFKAHKLVITQYIQFLRTLVSHQIFILAGIVGMQPILPAHILGTSVPASHSVYDGCEQ
jgi:BTB/POZ domain